MVRGPENGINLSLISASQFLASTLYSSRITGVLMSLKSYKITTDITPKDFLQYAFSCIISAFPYIREISLWMIEHSDGSGDQGSSVIRTERIGTTEGRVSSADNRNGGSRLPPLVGVVERTEEESTNILEGMNSTLDPNRAGGRRKSSLERLRNGLSSPFQTRPSSQEGGIGQRIGRGGGGLVMKYKTNIYAGYFGSEDATTLLASSINAGIIPGRPAATVKGAAGVKTGNPNPNISPTTPSLLLPWVVGVPVSLQQQPHVGLGMGMGGSGIGIRESRGSVSSDNRRLSKSSSATGHSNSIGSGYNDNMTSSSTTRPHPHMARVQEEEEVEEEMRVNSPVSRIDVVGGGVAIAGGGGVVNNSPASKPILPQISVNTFPSELRVPLSPSSPIYNNRKRSSNENVNITTTSVDETTLLFVVNEIKRCIHTLNRKTIRICTHHSLTLLGGELRNHKISKVYDSTRIYDSLFHSASVVNSSVNVTKKEVYAENELAYTAKEGEEVEEEPSKEIITKTQVSEEIPVVRPGLLRQISTMIPLNNNTGMKRIIGKKNTTIAGTSAAKNVSIIMKEEEELFKLHQQKNQIKIVEEGEEEEENSNVTNSTPLGNSRGGNIVNVASTTVDVNVNHENNANTNGNGSGNVKSEQPSRRPSAPLPKGPPPIPGSKPEPAPGRVGGTIVKEREVGGDRVRKPGGVVDSVGGGDGGGGGGGRKSSLTGVNGGDIGKMGGLQGRGGGKGLGMGSDLNESWRYYFLAAATHGKQI